MSDILSRIADYKRQEVAERKAKVSQAELVRVCYEATPPRGFVAALSQTPAGKLGLIAEIKKASPSRGVIREDFDVFTLAEAYAAGGATCLSILTDGPSFQGADEYLLTARDAVDLPCLRKEFLVDPYQVHESRALGADCILVIMAMIDDALAGTLMRLAEQLGMDALVEVHDEAELKRAVGLGARMIGINNRDLRTFVTDLAVTERLAPMVPDGALLVTESGIFTPADVSRLAGGGARAMLVGESLMRQADVAAATRALVT